MQLLRTALDLLRELKALGTMPRGYPQVSYSTTDGALSRPPIYRPIYRPIYLMPRGYPQVTSHCTTTDRTLYGAPYSAHSNTIPGLTRCLVGGVVCRYRRQ